MSSSRTRQGASSCLHKYLAHGSGAEEVEALACREGMQLAAEWCPSKVILESDCNYVVGLLRHGNFQRSRLKFLLEETREAGNMLLLSP